MVISNRRISRMDRLPCRSLSMRSNSLPLLRCLTGHGQVDTGRELEPQVRVAVDAKFTTYQPELEDVSTGAPVGCDEVEVVASYVQALGVVGKAEAHQAAPDVARFERGLALDDLREGG